MAARRPAGGRAVSGRFGALFLQYILRFVKRRTIMETFVWRKRHCARLVPETGRFSLARDTGEQVVSALRRWRK
jgi:hypothetical protein